jgi:hypothetical protein
VSRQYLDINGGELVVDPRGRKVNGEGVLPLLALRDGHGLVHDAQTLLEDENVINTLLSSSLTMWRSKLECLSPTSFLWLFLHL